MTHHATVRQETTYGTLETHPSSLEEKAADSLLHKGISHVILDFHTIPFLKREVGRFRAGLRVLIAFRFGIDCNNIGLRKDRFALIRILISIISSRVGVVRTGILFEYHPSTWYEIIYRGDYA